MVKKNRPIGRLNFFNYYTALRTVHLMFFCAIFPMIQVPVGNLAGHLDILFCPARKGHYRATFVLLHPFLLLIQISFFLLYIALLFI